MKKENGTGDRYIKTVSSLMLVAGLAGEIIYATFSLLL